VHIKSAGGQELSVNMSESRGAMGFIIPSDDPFVLLDRYRFLSEIKWGEVLFIDLLTGWDTISYHDQIHIVF
jgi:hypothetical protein